MSLVATHDRILLSLLTASQFNRSVRVVLIRDEMSASLTSSLLNGGGASGSSGMGGMLDLLGDMGGDSDPRRVLTEDDRELLRVPAGDGDCFGEKEKVGEGDENEEGDVMDPGLSDGLEELEQFESTDNLRRTCVC